MKKLIAILLLQGYLMAATLLSVDINGTKVPVIFEQDKKLPLRSIEFIFRDSGVLSSKKAGLVTLSADLLNEGDAKLGSTKFAKELEDRAIEFSANAGNETFVFSIDSMKEQFNFALSKLLELLKEPNYKENVFKKIQNKRLSVLTRKESDYDYIASNGLKSLLFANTPLANPRLGTPESVKNIKLNDIKKFINSHLYLDNLIVVVGGDFSKVEAKEIKHFSANSDAKTKEVKKETQQAYIYFGAPYDMKVDSKKRVIGKVASFILGSSGFGSRLMEEVRVKRGLAYSAYSRFIVNKTNSYFSGYLLIDNFTKNGATKKELDSAKKFFLGSEPLRVESLSQRLNRAFNEYYNGLGLGYSKKELKAIEELTLDELSIFIVNK